MTHASGRIVVGVDGSLTSLQALRRAVEFAREQDRPLQAVRVWKPSVCSYSKRDYSIIDHRIERRELRQLGDDMAAALGAPPGDIELLPQVRAREGNPGKVLTWLADRPDDLLVIGAARGGWRSALPANSVGRYCVRHARCPLHVVPLPELAHTVLVHAHQQGEVLTRAIDAG